MAGRGIPRALFALLLAVSLAAPRQAARAASVQLTGLHVQGNQIVNWAGQPVRLIGVNRSGTEYACVHGAGIFAGPTDAASVQAMLRWDINTVRIPLNEDCWLGINGVSPADAGAAYQRAIADYVTLLTQSGLAVILDLHWSAPGTDLATFQWPLPDRDHAVTFWTQVAATFKWNGSVIFDLFNEPYVPDSPAGWQCWRDGGVCTGVDYEAAGMQELVDAVRATGARNLILLAGVAFAEHLSQWLTYVPTDPARNLAASWHNETLAGRNLCAGVTCWASQVLPVAQQIPVVPTEIGESDCADTVVDPLMSWLDSYNLGYLAWTWTTGPCYFTGDITGASGMALIANSRGTPTAYGIGFAQHFVAAQG